MAWQSYYQRKSVLITGGSSGIGLALANRLMELGANVYLLARRQDALLEAEAGLQIHRQNANQKTGILQADVAD
ncbi:MAG TPA: SDR family NAD(P)-dependent oxidoreductase, partial [Anaerolineaceae bacterium]|nr:SDR family NAD(P)-dependent oxidoreductase [Anaerolineaceae bacterium]